MFRAATPRLSSVARCLTPCAIAGSQVMLQTWASRLAAFQMS
jgi:hypothetical protein